MKIAHINLAKGIRGGENQTLALIEGLSEFKELDQTLICRKNSDLEKKAKEKNIKILSIGKPFFINAFRLKKFNILHVHEGRSTYLAYFANVLFKIPYIITRRIPNKPHDKSITKKAYKNAACIVSLSKKINSVMREFAASKRFEIIPSIARELKPSQNEVENLKKRFEGKFVIGHIGALSDHHKNQSLIIKAAKLLQDKKDIIFIFLGNGKDEKMLKEMALGLDNIIFEGYKTNTADYYAIFDLFVYPSKEEGLGSAILEAFGFKLPVIASNVDGIPDIVINNQNGLLINPADKNELKEKIELLYNNKELRKKLSNSGFEFKNGFSSKILSRKYYNLYKEISNKIN